MANTVKTKEAAKLSNNKLKKGSVKNISTKVSYGKRRQQTSKKRSSGKSYK